MTNLDGAQGRAAALLARCNLAILRYQAARRQAVGRDVGARPPAALAGAPVALVRVVGAGTDAATAPGHKTARRPDPPIIRALDAYDPRRLAAQMLADAFERVGTVRGVDWAGADSKRGVSDGGVTTRVKHAARLRLIEYAANGWPIDRRDGPARRTSDLRPRVVRAMLRPCPKRQEIHAFPALVAICVEGLDLGQLLERYGWSAQTYNRQQVRRAVLDALGDVAVALGVAAPASK